MMKILCDEFYAAFYDRGVNTHAQNNFTIFP